MGEIQENVLEGMGDSDSELKTSIAAVPEDSSKARCKYCNTDIRAHLNDLEEHVAMKKNTVRPASNLLLYQRDLAQLKMTKKVVNLQPTLPATLQSMPSDIQKIKGVKGKYW